MAEGENNLGEHRVPSDVVAASDIVRGGGERLRIWVAETLNSYLERTKALAYGGAIVPQIGESSGKSLELVHWVSEDLLCLRNEQIVELTRRIWAKCKTDPEISSIECSHGSNHLAFIIAPIALWFDRPIGHLWAILQEGADDPQYILLRLSQAAGVVALAVRAEKACQAISDLARAVWMGASTTMKAAQEVAEACRAALSCMAVIIWQMDPDAQLLKTLAAVGNAGPGLRVDLHRGEGVAGKCAEDDKVIVVDDLCNPDELGALGIERLGHIDMVKAKGWRSAIFVPLDIGGEYNTPGFLDQWIR